MLPRQLERTDVAAAAAVLCDAVFETIDDAVVRMN